MNLAGTDDHALFNQQGGLGFLDSTRSILDIELFLTPHNSLAPASPSSHSSRRAKGRASKDAKSAPKENNKEIKIAVQVQQDLAALKGRRGDTGESYAAWGLL
jgi:hypothetical protein